MRYPLNPAILIKYPVAMPTSCRDKYYAYDEMKAEFNERYGRVSERDHRDFINVIVDKLGI